MVHGGAGSDYLSDEGTGSNELWGDGGQDSLLGGAGDDKLYGGDNGDSLTGGAGDDLMEGGAGYDVFHPGSAAEGTDVMRGGADDDLVDYCARTAPVIVTLDGVVNDGEPGEQDVIAEIEDARGGRGDDRLTGDEFDNTLYGGPAMMTSRAAAVLTLSPVTRVTTTSTPGRVTITVTLVQVRTSCWAAPVTTHSSRKTPMHRITTPTFSTPVRERTRSAIQV